MKNLVKVQIDAPIEKVAKIIANPKNNKLWMVNLRSYKQLSGEPGEAGSSHELKIASERGDIVFVATVTERDLPNSFSVSMDSDMIRIVANATLKKLSAHKTEYSFEQDFQFKGLLNKIFGFFAQKSIKEQQAKDVESFKKFAEQ